MRVSSEIRVDVRCDSDVISARQAARTVAETLAFSSSDVTLIVTAVSEIARNVVSYAQRGVVLVRALGDSGREGIEVVAQDDGPGIEDIGLAMKDGFSTGKSLGLGLPGSRRIMDDFTIESVRGEGTCVTMRKWVPC